MHVVEARSFLVAVGRLRGLMLEHGQTVATETWQGLDVRGRPDAATTELLNVSLGVNLRGIRTLSHWRQECQPNLPWADDHFLERVSGKPLNPPPSWEWWPWAGSAAKFRNDQKFNHTYPERYWPKHAGHDECHAAKNPHIEIDPRSNQAICITNFGIRAKYGDLNDVIELLRQQPHTRQAYLPIFFPEDTGVGDGGRKPCTLGYHFIRRGNELHVVYPMRSCDLVRHFQDDCYLTVRLLLWVLEQLEWHDVKPGTLTMHITSLHVFANDMITLRKQ